MNTVKIHHEQGKLRQELTIGRHHLIADEPVELGGEDTGPGPFDYLAAALASCTAITLRLYAQKKGWPLQDAEIEVSVIQEPGLTRLERKLKLIGTLDEEQTKRLLEIADRCPVHRALTSKIEIRAIS